MAGGYQLAPKPGPPPRKGQGLAQARPSGAGARGPSPAPGPFFLLDNGARPTDCCARRNFALVSQELGLREPQRFCKHGRGSRIHDLRHTFAVRAIIGWYRKGLDPDREMIKLSTYLGHTKPEHTYWYIEAVPELLQLASKRTERALAAGTSERNGP